MLRSLRFYHAIVALTLLVNDTGGAGGEHVTVSTLNDAMMCLIDWVDLEIGIKVRVEDGTMRPEKVGGLECWKRLHLETAIPWIWSYCEGQSRGISYKTAWCHVWSKEPFRDSSSRVYTITCLNDCYSFFFLSL